MRIAQVSTLSAPVRHETTGSVESLVWLMAREMTRRGHEVTVFATGDSAVPGELVATLPAPCGTPGSFDDWQLCEWLNLCRAVGEADRFDVLHAHAYLWGMPLQRFTRVPMVHTLHIVPDENAARLWKLFPEAHVTALSRAQWEPWPDCRPVAVIPHGVEAGRFQLRVQPEDYVCYLGRFTSGKGPLQAIKAAQKLGIDLVLAGPENAYFRERVRPLVDGKRVRYAGYVSGGERERLLGGARALLYPIQYPEAFGLVLVEAMLCGTPVAAMGMGAVPEIVEPGVTGAIAGRAEEFEAAVQAAMPLDRSRVRAAALERFSVERMVEGYVSVYERVTAGGASHRHRKQR